MFIRRVLDRFVGGAGQQFSVYPPTGSSNTHIDEVLTNISLGWSNPALVAEQLFPTVTVRKQSDKYYTFGRESWLPESGDFRAPGTEANEIPGVGVSTDTYYAQEHALQIAVTDEERENVDSPMSPDRDGAELVTNKILLGRELAMKTLVTDASQYASSMTVTLSGTDQWSDYTNSDPIGDMKDARHAMHALTFMEPNTALIPYQVMSVLEDHPDFLERIKYSERAILTPDLIAAVIGFPGKIIIPGTGIATAADLIPSYLWGKDVLFAWVPPRPGLRVPAFAYEFVWGYGGGQKQVVDRWRENKRKSDLIRCQRRYDLKLVGRENNPASPNNGLVVTGYLIKNAVA